MKLNSSVTGFLGSLCFHGILFGVVIYFLFFRFDDSANGHQAPIGTHISMEMLKGMVKATPTPEVTPEPVVEEKVVETPPIPEPVKKEVVADPTVKKEPVKKEVKEIKPEKPKPKKIHKEKPKPKKVHKEKPKKKETRQGSKNIASKDKVNSVASNTSAANSNNPNLIGKGSNTDVLAAYKAALRRAIERRKRYPQRAKLMRKQGTVIVGFRIDKQGNLSNIHIVKSSSSSDLDRAALKAVKGVSSIGPRPIGLQENISIPINFRIH